MILPYWLALKEAILFCIIILCCLIWFFPILFKISDLQPIRYSFGQMLAKILERVVSEHLSIPSLWIFLSPYLKNIEVLPIVTEQNIIKPPLWAIRAPLFIAKWFLLTIDYQGQPGFYCYLALFLPFTLVQKVRIAHHMTGLVLLLAVNNIRQAWYLSSWNL